MRFETPQVPSFAIECYALSVNDGICSWQHYSDVIMSAMASQITGAPIVYSTVCSGADQRKYLSSASLAFVRGIHRWPVNSPQQRASDAEVFPFDDVIMKEIKGSQSPRQMRYTRCVIRPCNAAVTVKSAYWLLIFWHSFGAKMCATTLKTLAGRHIPA